MKTLLLEIKEMDCAHEVGLIEKKMGPLEGVVSFKINLVQSQVDIRYRPEMISSGEIIRKIGETGLSAREVGETPSKKNLPLEGLLSILGCGVFLVTAMVSSHIGSSGIPILFYSLSILLGGIPLARKGFIALRHLALDMNFLMTVAVTGAVAIGEWLEAASITFLFAVAQYLESRAMRRAGNAIRSLMAVAPSEAWILRDGRGVCLPVDEVRIGETLLIRPGERVALDGKILHGVSEINQAPITGESMPVAKGTGDPVFAGTINGSGALEVETLWPAQETTLARIVRMVGEAQCKKAPSQNFVDRFARIYTPAVIFLALAAGLVPPLLFHEPLGEWIYRALVLLVISCPCALVISTPVAVVSGITRAAREGILIKGGKFLEAAGTLKAVAFDKTGTLTRGVPFVTDVLPFNNCPPEKVLELAAAVESRSEHHLSRAILDRAKRDGLSVRECKSFAALPGKGARAEVDGSIYYLGNHLLFRELGFSTVETDAKVLELEREAKTVVLLGDEKKIIGLLGIIDEIRAESLGALEELRRLGINKMVLLTGDNKETAKAIAKRLHIEDYQAELLPEDKVAAVEKMTRELGATAMIGDGVNDAPAMAAATVGIAMGSAGTDAALETSDIALMADDLSKLPDLVALGRRTLRIIQTNIAFAVGTKAAFILLALWGQATLWMAVGADMGASLLVIFNGLRLLRK